MLTIKRKTITSICDKLREKLSSDRKYNSTEIAEGIETICANAIEKEKELTWKMLTDNGNRPYFAYAFAYADFSDYEFYKPIIPTDNIGQLFFRYAGKSLPKNIDLSQAPTSNSSRTRVFYYCTKVTEIDCMGIVPGKYIDTFYNCYSAKKITGFNVDENSTFENTFYKCNALENIEINGIIGTDISFAYSPLTAECIKNIISCLKDYSGTNTTHTITLKADRENMLTNEEKTLATNKGWTLVWG